MEESTPSLLNEIRERLQLLEASLPSRADAASLSLRAKIPFKALWYREALIWRFAELCRSAFKSFEDGNLVSAIILTRAAVETSAALWYLRAKIMAVSESGAVADIDNDLMRLIGGSRTDPAMPQAINVLTFVDKVDKDVQGFRRQYDALCEYAHPNSLGTVFVYSKPDPEMGWADLGSNVRQRENVEQCGVINLSVVMEMFEVGYNQIADLMPSFVAVCERQLSS